MIAATYSRLSQSYSLDLPFVFAIRKENKMMIRELEIFFLNLCRLWLNFLTHIKCEARVTTPPSPLILRPSSCPLSLTPSPTLTLSNSPSLTLSLTLFIFLSFVLNLRSNLPDMCCRFSRSSAPKFTTFARFSMLQAISTKKEGLN